MISRSKFFIVFIITCIIISFLFYLLFRHDTTSLIPYSFMDLMGLSAIYPSTVDISSVNIPSADTTSNITQTGLPGMNNADQDDTLGKPLPTPNMPIPPVPLIVKVEPSSPPLKKPMME